MYLFIYKMEMKEYIVMIEKFLGSIEVGGIKFVCGVGIDDLIIVECVSFFIIILEEIMKKVIEFF